MSNTSREILFRGKREEHDFYGLGGEWIYGIPIQTHIGTFLCFEKNPHYCNQYGYMEIEEISKVVSETVGAYTGLTDKNGTKIFEGDILLAGDGDTYVVEYRNDWTAFTARQFGGNPNYNPFLFTISDRCKIIGNIHDNPNLLETHNET